MIPAKLRKHIAKVGVPKTKMGDPELLYSSACADRQELERVAPLADGSVVLDVGCGYGRLGLAFAGTRINYVGLDVNLKRFFYAVKLLEPYPNCSCMHMDIRNDHYNAGSLQDPGQFHVGVPDGLFHAACAISLFTHMPERRHVEAYLTEIGRLVRANGALLTTWLLDPPLKVADSNGSLAIYHVGDVTEMLHKAGFEVVSAIGEGKVGNHYRVLSRRTNA